MKARITNHKTDGEIGGLFNHQVSNAIGWVSPKLFNHEMQSAAPNCQQVVNHDLADCASNDELAKVLGVFKYPGRVLGATNKGDIVQFHPSLKPNWDWIKYHYQRIGLEFSQEIIWDDDFGILKDFPKHSLSVFFFGARAHQARPDKDWYQTTKEMNSKNNFIHLCKKLGIKTPKTFCFSSKEEVADTADFNFPVFLKIAESVSGLGVVRCENREKLEKELAFLNPNIAFQIQEAVEAVAFINVQYRANGFCQRVAITEQILDGYHHAGNKFPSHWSQPWAVTDSLAEILAQKGIKGYFAFDLAVTKQGEYLPIECNPRFNGSTYPTLIAQKLGLKSWQAKSFAVNFSKLNDLDLAELEYDSKAKSGVIVYNWGCVSDGKLGVILAGPENRAKKQEERFKHLVA